MGRGYATSENFNKAKFAFWAFLEVAPTLLTLHTGHVDQLGAGPTGPALSDKEVS
jgi:hypothetical protein